jgi:hypothetical protein
MPCSTSDPSSAMNRSQWSPAIFSDPAYLEERFRRIALTGIPRVEAERLKEFCASLAPKK